MTDAYAEQVGGNHYKTFEIQPGEYCYRNRLNNYQSEAISYISRYDRKWKDNPAKQIEDLKKAIHTIQLLIAEVTLYAEAEGLIDEVS